MSFLFTCFATHVFHLYPYHATWDSGHSHLICSHKSSFLLIYGEPHSHSLIIHNKRCLLCCIWPALRCKSLYNMYTIFLIKAKNVGCDFSPSLAQTKDTRGIYASSSNASSSSVTFSCNLLVHSSSLSMERCSIDVPGSQRNVSMHGCVIGPILMLEM